MIFAAEDAAGLRTGFAVSPGFAARLCALTLSALLIIMLSTSAAMLTETERRERVTFSRILVWDECYSEPSREATGRNRKRL